MALLGDLDGVKALLRSVDDTTFGVDDEQRLAELRNVVSSAMEFELRRTFGSPASDGTRLLYAGPHQVLTFPVPCRSISAVLWNPTVKGGTVTGGQTFTTAEYVHFPVDSRTGEIMGIKLRSGGVWGWHDPNGSAAVPVQITADWVDTDDDTSVPDEITYAVNYVIAETFKNQKSGSGGTMGPDGQTIYPRNPWKDPLVVRAVEKHTSANRRMVAF